MNELPPELAELKRDLDEGEREYYAKIRDSITENATKGEDIELKAKKTALLMLKWEKSAIEFSVLMDEIGDGDTDPADISDILEKNRELGTRIFGNLEEMGAL